MFLLLKLICSIIIFIISLCFNLIKFIYKIIVLIFKCIKFLLLNKHSRIPTLIIIIGLLLNLNLSIIFTIYFLYLLNIFALYNGIYLSINNNLKIYFNNIKNNLSIKKLLKLLPSNNIVINNLFLENDETTLNIHHLAITPNGLYNIIPLSIFLDTYDTDKVNSSRILFDIYNETEIFKKTLIDIIEDEIPLTTIVLASNKGIVNTLESENFKLAEAVELAYIINSTSTHNPSFDADIIKDILFENKAWFLDIISIKFANFLHKNKKIILFFIFSPIVYCIYMLILLFICNGISVFISYLNEFFSSLINTYTF